MGAGATREPLVCVAQVATAHGVRGALKLRCFTEEPENVAAYGPLCDHEGRELFTIEAQGRTNGGLIVRAEGITSRNAAMALRGLFLYVPRARLPEIDTDEFYHEDLIGLEAVDPAGSAFGEVVAVHNFGAGDVIEVRALGGVAMLVPFTREAVPEVDLEHGRVVIDPPRAS